MRARIDLWLRSSWSAGRRHDPCCPDVLACSLSNMHKDCLRRVRVKNTCITRMISISTCAYELADRSTRPRPALAASSVLHLSNQFE